jgi:hypothetical protein
MKIFKALAIAITVLTTQSLFAQDYKNAVGLRFAGDGYAGGLGINYKHFLGEGSSAIDLTLRAERAAAFSALYQIHTQIKSEQSLQWHYGVGGFLTFPKNGVGVGAMGNLGIEFTFKDVPLNLGLDWRPELLLAPTLDAEFSNIGLSVRFVIGR